MDIIEFKKIHKNEHNNITFIRIQPKDLNVTITEIIRSLNDLAWISDFEEDFIQESFLERAKPTIVDITKKIKKRTGDKVSSEAGEYIVSSLSQKAIISKMSYLDVPLSELYSKQKSGNPGFDFHTENKSNIIIFGEAKYVNSQNAYGKGLEQVVRFIKEKKDIKDLIDLEKFCSSQSLKNASKGLKGYAVGFSSKKTATDRIISGIIKNKDFKLLLPHQEIVMVAVNI